MEYSVFNVLDRKLSSGEILTYKWRNLNAEGAEAPLFFTL